MAFAVTKPSSSSSFVLFPPISNNDNRPNRKKHISSLPFTLVVSNQANVLSVSSVRSVVSALGFRGIPRARLGCDMFTVPFRNHQPPGRILQSGNNVFTEHRKPDRTEMTWVFFFSGIETFFFAFLVQRVVACGKTENSILVVEAIKMGKNYSFETSI